MNLYRIILVDDEEEVRKGIIRKIDWNHLGFEVVGDAENGAEALEKIEQLEPEVVMTDIRMPFMDGLALTERIRQKYPSMKVLIFSGFDDFEYAQQAIKLNVTEYILKPVNVEELSEILTRVRKNLDEEISQRRDAALLRESYQKSLPILRAVFLNDLMRGTADAGMIEEKLKEYSVDILHAKKWLTALIHIEAENAEGPNALQKELIPISVRQIAEDHLRDYCRFTIFNSSAGITLIAAIDENNSQTGLLDHLGDICKECRRVLEVTVTIAVGHSCQKLSELSRVYQSAVDALGYRSIVGVGQTIYINDVEPVSRGKLKFDNADENDFITAVKFGPEEKIRETIHSLMTRMDDARVHVRQQQMYMLSLFNCVTRLMQQYDLTTREIFDTEKQYLDIQAAIGKPEKFESWILGVSFRIHEGINRERDNTTKKVILEARRYVENHYQDPSLSVEMICRELHMSPAYFSTMFRKVTGQTYIAYLTEVRLQKAVELLNETDDKTYVIAQKVGYQEQNYFSYVFKKRFGISPTKYRGTQNG